MCYQFLGSNNRNLERRKHAFGPDIKVQEYSSKTDYFIKDGIRINNP